MTDSDHYNLRRRTPCGHSFRLTHKRFLNVFFRIQAHGGVILQVHHLRPVFLSTSLLGRGRDEGGGLGGADGIEAHRPWSLLLTRHVIKIHVPGLDPRGLEGGSPGGGTVRLVFLVATPWLGGLHNLK